jgi:hypothetical protein
LVVAGQIASAARKTDPEWCSRTDHEGRPLEA